MTNASEEVIAFTEQDTKELDMPHNDPLVINLRVDGQEIRRVLVDTGCSTNLIFASTLARMGLEGESVNSSTDTILSFDGSLSEVVGCITLTTTAGGETRKGEFLVIDKPAIFNLVLGTPWLHEMQAIASTYHQCLKFPTKKGITVVRGDQRESRECFRAEHKLRGTPRRCLVVQAAVETIPMGRDHPKREEIIQVNIDATDPTRCVGIGAGLTPEVRKDLERFLRDNSRTFAWSAGDMPGIDPKIICHELNVDPTYRPVRQKRRKLGPERAQAVNDEVERLTKAGSIMEVQYPDWLANPVVVKKKNGKWRTCVDFTDLNKACPKDSFPLPHIDRIVEATAGHELLSFMDAFSGYNQIMMNPDDREKTSFITDRGTYCYKVMPFGLKNAGATYQRLVNRMFSEQIGQTMEVYIDDMLVKSSSAKEHVQHLRACFEVLNQYQMKLNPAKCTFGVSSGEFLGYIVTQRGIEANPKQISAILDLPSPRSPKEVQRLTGRIAALNRFISRSSDKCLPFYQLLRANKRFLWDERCEAAFKQLKEYLTTPPILAKPEDGETLYLYIAVSASAVSSVLVREDRGEQKPIFYTSKALDGAESRYTALEKLALAVVSSSRKLRPYFQSHAIVVLSSHPIRNILHSPSQSGRLAKWAVELSEYDIEYKCRTSAKSQVLADFLIELPAEITNLEAKETPWSLYVDGSSSQNGSGIGIHLISPTKELLEQSFRLGFAATNNEAEYEALLAGLRLARGIDVKSLKAYSDSQLVTNQYNGEYEARNERMDAYLRAVKELANDFTSFELIKIPRTENAMADALAALASSSEQPQKRTIPVGTIDRPSVTFHQEVCQAIHLEREGQFDDPIDNDEDEQVDEEEADWRNEIIAYLYDGHLPQEKWAARRLRTRSAQYCLINGKLYRRDVSGTLLTCIHGVETRQVMIETHEGAGGNHSGGRTLAFKIKSLGYYWPTMLADCIAHASKCEPCQRHGPIINSPAEEISTAIAPYPFMRWAMDLVGPLPESGGKKYILVLTDYFTKWVEAGAYKEVTATTVKRFIWKNVICRHGIPYEIVTDNGSQFISKVFEKFCARWRIRLNKSSPRYPQGNGQAEASNKKIVNNLKKRLLSEKTKWATELDGVLWSYRTTACRATGRSPFALSHGVEALAPAEAVVATLRRTTWPQDFEANNKALKDNVDMAEELRQQATIRIDNYQRQVAKYYNKKVRGRHFVEGDLVLRKVYENTAERPITKLGSNWEGPYQISKVIRPGVYELMTMDGSPELRRWNVMNLKRYHF